MQRRIDVLLFAAIRDAAGTDRWSVVVDEQTTAGDVVNQAAEKFPEVAAILRISRLAIDGKYVAADFVMTNVNDPEIEVALIPPVSGG